MDTFFKGLVLSSCFFFPNLYDLHSSVETK